MTTEEKIMHIVCRWWSARRRQQAIEQQDIPMLEERIALLKRNQQEHKKQLRRQIGSYYQDLGDWRRKEQEALAALEKALELQSEIERL